jgi:hypothetical protein
MRRKKYKLLPAYITGPGRYATEVDPRLTPGDHVKLGFRVDPEYQAEGLNGEWMWFEVTAVEGQWPNVLYRGELLNLPLFIDPAVLRLGQPVEFRGEHIHTVTHASELGAEED